MNVKAVTILSLLSLTLSSSGVAAAKAEPSRKTASALKLRTDQRLSFDSQVVEGEVYRPDYSVVTGESPGEGWGILRLRSNFADHERTDSAENLGLEKRR